MSITPSDQQGRFVMTPLDDHELLLGPRRAGLTRAAVSQTVRRGLGTGRILRQRADETDVQRLDCIYVDMEVIQVVAGVGGVAAGAP